MLLAFHKPFGVLSQFTPDGSKHRPLADFGFPKGVYPIGRLDGESEGLLLLSDEGELNARLLHPKHGHRRTYWALVEREPTTEALQKLERGLVIGGHRTLPCRSWRLDPQPTVPPRIRRCAFARASSMCGSRWSWLREESSGAQDDRCRRPSDAAADPGANWGFPFSRPSPGTWRELDAAERVQVFA
jgi:23S rRNA pseudouridine2457 synthase